MRVYAARRRSIYPVIGTVRSRLRPPEFIYVYNRFRYFNYGLCSYLQRFVYILETTSNYYWKKKKKLLQNTLVHENIKYLIDNFGVPGVESPAVSSENIRQTTSTIFFFLPSDRYYK